MSEGVRSPRSEGEQVRGVEPGGGLSKPRPFWVSWWQSATPFTWHGPWWVSGWRSSFSDDEDNGQASICAAVMARDAVDAKRLIVAAHDVPVELEWRFLNPQAVGWTPFCDRFKRAKWMKWPWPKTASNPAPGGVRSDDPAASATRTPGEQG